MILVKDSKNVNVIFVNLSYSYIYIYNNRSASCFNDKDDDYCFNTTYCFNAKDATSKSNIEWYEIREQNNM